MVSLKNKGFRRVLYSLAVIALIIISGGLVFHFIEGLGWLDAFYYAIMTLTTIATINPVHDVTKIFLMGYALFGVASVLYLVTGVASYYLEQRESMFEKRVERLTEMVQTPTNRVTGIFHRKNTPVLPDRPTLIRRPSKTDPSDGSENAGKSKTQPPQNI